MTKPQTDNRRCVDPAKVGCEADISTQLTKKRSMPAPLRDYNRSVAADRARARLTATAEMKARLMRRWARELEWAHKAGAYLPGQKPLKEAARLRAKAHKLVPSAMYL